MIGESKFFLVFQVKQIKEGTFIYQTKYVKDMLKKFDMADAKPIKTPITLNGHLNLNKEEKSVDQKVHCSMIGSLLYLCAFRPDIMLSVCMCARLQANPKECYLMAVKRNLRYLVHTPNIGFWYPKGSTFDLLGYSDSDYASCKVHRKSTMGTCQFLGRSLVSWSSKKQNWVALCTLEVEYVAADACYAQLLWMKQTLRDFGCKFNKIPLLCDNESAIKLANNPVTLSNKAHRYKISFLKEAKGDIVLRHVTGTRGCPIFRQEDNYQFVDNPTQAIRLPINKTQAYNRSTTSPLGYQPCAAWLILPRRVILTCNSKNTSKNKEECNKIASE
jgi:hypothetical protein